MMKKINISSQLIILFFATILISSCIFILITVSYMTYDSEEEIFLRLRTELTLISNDDYDNEVDFKKINIAYVSSFEGNDNKSANLNHYVSDNQVEERLNKIDNEIDVTNEFIHLEYKKKL